MINIIYLKEYRKIFFGYAAATFLPFAIMVYATLNYQPVDPLFSVETCNFIFTLYIIGLAAIAFDQKNRRDKLLAFRSIDQRIEAYKSFYISKLIGSAIMAIVPAILFLITSRYFFLYFGLFVLLSVVTNYPFRSNFRKELKDDQIVFA